MAHNEGSMTQSVLPSLALMEPVAFVWRDVENDLSLFLESSGLNTVHGANLDSGFI